MPHITKTRLLTVRTIETKYYHIIICYHNIPPDQYYDIRISTNIDDIYQHVYGEDFSKLKAFQIAKSKMLVKIFNSL